MCEIHKEMKWSGVVIFIVLCANSYVLVYQIKIDSHCALVDEQKLFIIMHN